MQEIETDKPELYYSRMDSSQDDKSKILQFVKEGDTILDVGAGSGVITNLLLSKNGTKVCSVDTCDSAIEHLRGLEESNPGRVSVKKADFLEIDDGEKFDVVVFSAILHEIFSYTEYNGEKFNFAIIDHALKKAASLLALGGRIIVRDGIMPTSNRRVMLQYIDPEMKELADRYIEEFRGFDLKVVRTEYGDVMPNRSAAELMFTITWGRESFPREVQEWFGYYSAKDWKRQEQRLMATHCVSMIHFEEYLQPGYEEHLKDKVKLLSAPKFNRAGDVVFKPTTFPNTNCLVVFHKLQ